MHFIKDIFEKNKSEHSHNKFIRYSKGDFLGPLMKIRFSKKEIKIGASYHYSDELLILLGKLLGHEMVHISGSLVWNKDLSEDFLKLGMKYLKVTKVRGIFKYTLDNETDIKNFVDTMIEYNLLAKIKGENYSYITKNSFPKPNKEFGPDFVKVVFPASFAKTILDEFAFDIKTSPKKILEISHRIIIEDIILPEDTSDFDIARRLATRKGNLSRKVIIDKGEPQTSEIDINI